MSSACESKTIKVSDLVDLYQRGQIRKPRIQRKLRWVDKNDDMPRKYIQFGIKQRNMIYPYLFAERIVEGKKIYIVIDGNNRINAILMFTLRPLRFLPGLIPDYPSDVQKAIKESSLTYLQKVRNFRTFCNENGFMSWLQSASANPTLDDPFETMQDTLREYKFMDINLPITVFQNKTDEEIHDIYQNVNEGGKKLTRQEILACVTDVIKFRHDEIILYNEIKAHVDTYYAEMEVTEKLQLEEETTDTLNLFEVLLGLQAHLHKQYTFVPRPGDPTQLDLIFKIYEFIIGGFCEKPANLADFIAKICLYCKTISDCYGSIINPNINYKSIKKYSAAQALSENGLFLLMVRMSVSSLETKLLKRCLLYNELVDLVEDKDKRSLRNTTNPLHFSAGGTFVQNAARRVFERGTFDSCPSDDDVRDVLTQLSNEHTKAHTKEKKRVPITRFQTIVLSLYYNANVPLDLLSLKKELDHIVPYSLDTGSAQIDLERLGNKMLIDATTNRKRGVRAITREFIEEHRLYYHNYPSETQYSAITEDGKTLTSADAYNSLAEGREKAYFDWILSSLQ